MKDLFAKCGNNCGRCALYKDNLTDESKHRCAEGMAKYINWRPKPENLRQCAGCQTTEGFLYIRNCGVRLCAFHNGVKNCAYCAVFPCQDVPTVSVSVDFRSQVAERLGSPIPEQDYQAFIEPYEGMKHLEQIRALLDPEDIVKLAEVQPLRARMLGFPDDLALPKEEAASFRTLYDLMTDILSGRADLYVRQVALKKRRPVILTVLWVLGRYGELSEDGSELVIDGEAHGSRADFKSIVRKRDNALHAAAAISAGLLRDFGITVEHVPLKRKAWMLKMSADDRAGRAATLTALKRYVARLVEVYGEPVYAGSARYKGEAFERFSKADMRVLGQEKQ